MYIEKLLPHDIEAEESVIGSMLIDGESVLKVARFLKPVDFYREKNRFCYEACLDLFRRSEAINQVTVAHQLDIQDRLEDVGGTAYLSHMVSVVPTPVHIEFYGQIVSRTAMMRNLIDAASQISAIGYEDTSDVDASSAGPRTSCFEFAPPSPPGTSCPSGKSLTSTYSSRQPLQSHRGLWGPRL